MLTGITVCVTEACLGCLERLQLLDSNKALKLISVFLSIRTTGDKNLLELMVTHLLTRHTHIRNSLECFSCTVFLKEYCAKSANCQLRHYIKKVIQECRNIHVMKGVGGGILFKEIAEINQTNQCNTCTPVKGYIEGMRARFISRK